MPYTLNELYKTTVLHLKAQFPAEEARAMADRLFEHYFKLAPVQRIIDGNSIAEDSATVSVEKAVQQLLNNMPLQYILGFAWFMDLEIEVNPSVLIPRPETEEMVSLILEYLKGRQSPRKPSIMDIGTGSGCIAIAIKKNLPESEVTAIDISVEALKVARRNAKSNLVEINFIHADMLNQSQWFNFPQVDLIVSNPPYVTHEEKKQMHRNVLDHEPHTALFVPDDDPLVFYHEIIALAKSKLCESGSLWFEINENFGEELRNMALKQGFKEVNIIFDFRGKSRFLQCFNK